jgi:hypothetical protein
LWLIFQYNEAHPTAAIVRRAKAALAAPFGRGSFNTGRDVVLNRDRRKRRVPTRRTRSISLAPDCAMGAAGAKASQLALLNRDRRKRRVPTRANALDISPT